MERRFYHDEFEDLIKQKADQYKMYPSERVWKEIHRAVHPRKKWYWIGFALLLSGIGYYSVSELTNTPQPANQIASENNKVSSESLAPPASLLPFIQPSASTFTEKGNSQKQLSHNRQAPVVQMLPIEERNSGVIESGDQSSNIGSEFSVPQADVESNWDELEEILFDLKDLSIVPVESPSQAVAIDAHKQEDIRRTNWLQEYAAYDLSPSRPKRLSFQVFISPTMNYRKLTGDRNANMKNDVKNVPMALKVQGDVEGFTNHKPALGFELGSAVFYALNKNFSLKAGLQFNYSRYTIQAYSGSAELATIALNTGVSGYGNDSIVNYSQIRNFGGSQVTEFQNQYFQLSAPIGAEWRVIGNGKLQFNVAGTLQPTYLLNRNTYLITTDYKNYTKEPSLVRRWNVNTSAEAYLSYNTGSVRWQLGPQFRYQLLSSYVDEYPVKEFLMEYGVKFGVTKTIR